MTRVDANPKNNHRTIIQLSKFSLLLIPLVLVLAAAGLSSQELLLVLACSWHHHHGSYNDWAMHSGFRRSSSLLFESNTSVLIHIILLRVGMAPTTIGPCILVSAAARPYFLNRTPAF